MKKWVRIVVTIGVIIVIGFTIWAFCFREKDNVQAYNRTAELIDYKESLGLSEKLDNLKTMNYCGEDSSNIISSTSTHGAKIYKYRNICLSETPIVGDNNAYEYDSYIVTEGYVDEIIAYCLPLTKSDSVNNQSLRNLKTSIKSYIASLQELNSCIDELMTYQKSITGDDLGGLSGRYASMYSKYRISLSNSSNVITALLNYIDKGVYSDKYIVDVKSAVFDAFARALSVSTTVTENLENDYANDVRVIADRIDDINNDVNFFTQEYTEYDFVESYNKLFNSYSGTLDYVFERKNLEKIQMAGGTNLSQVKEGAKTSVTTILYVLGFVGV